MKKFFTMLLLLFSAFSIAVAQPATSQKGSLGDLTPSIGSQSTCVQGVRDGLEVEIVDFFGNHFDHPQHPANGLICNSQYWFTTEDMWDAYLWETSAIALAPVEDAIFICDFQESGYLKLTVWDNLGNSGSDSIWFNVKSSSLYPMQPMENFVMEIDDDLHASFSGTATSEHSELWIQRTNDNGASLFEVGDFWLEPGEWSFVDDVEFNGEDLWIYYARLFDTCGNFQDDYVPGMFLSVITNGPTNYLSTSTILQQYGDYYHQFGNWVYFVYTIDQDGVCHHFVESGEPVVLPDDATRWEIPGPNADPYYQCGVAQILEDGSYKLLSLSNKVDNPLYDPTGISEHEQSIAIYPNPTTGRFLVKGTGVLKIFDTLGQCLLTEEIDGEFSVNLPSGMYFVNIGSVTRKVIVQ